MTAGVLIVGVADCSTQEQARAEFVEVGVMIDPDEVMEGLEAEEDRIEELVRRSTAQARDIKNMKEELAKLKEDVSEDQEPIPSEQVEG